MLKFARSHGANWNINACYAAARGNQLEMLQYLRANGCPWRRNDLLTFAHGCHTGPLREWVDTQPVKTWPEDKLD